MFDVIIGIIEVHVLTRYTLSRIAESYYFRMR